MSTDTTWTPSCVHVVASNLFVSSGVTLTIEPGAIVKIRPSLGVFASGSLVADAAGGPEIIFTSFRDDDYGGDTNGDGSGTAPAPGDWKTIVAYSNSSTLMLDGVRVRYGGYSGESSDYFAAVSNRFAPLASGTITASTIEQSSTAGVGWDGALQITSSEIRNNGGVGIGSNNGANAIIDSNRIENNNGDGIQIGGQPPQSITGNTFLNNDGYAFYIIPSSGGGGTTVSGNSGSGNFRNAIAIGGQWNISTTLGANPSLPYLVVSQFIFTGSANLTIAPGVIIKMLPSRGIYTSGQLNAIGTASQNITITSDRDDSVDGDTNGDGGATLPAPGDWFTVCGGYSAMSVMTLDYVRVRYGGRSSEYGAGGMISNRCGTPYYNGVAVAAITRSAIEQSAGSGFEWGGGASATIENSTVSDNTSYGIGGGTPGNYLIARNNYWGDPSGPNSDGGVCSPESLEMDPPGVGDVVSCYVYFYPWAGYAPALPPTAANGSPQSNPFSAFSLEPVNLATGNYTHQHTDVAIAGKGLPLAYARSYNSVAVTDGPLGYGWQDNLHAKLEFDNADHSIANVTVVGEEGKQDGYTRQPDATYTPSPGVFAVLTRNSGDGAFTLRRKDRSKLHFDSNGVFQSMEDRNGNQTTLTYSAGLLTTATDPSGRTLTFAYDGNGHTTSVADPLGRVTTYTYDANGDLRTVTDPELQTTAYTYDGAHQMLTITDPRGNVVMTNVFTAGKVTQQTNADGKIWAFTYNVGNTVETDPLGRTTTHFYDPSLRETSVVDALGGTTAYGYDGYGSRNAVTDPLGRTTIMSYDARGNLLTLADALGNMSFFTYSAEDDLLSKTDANGRLTTMTYDASGNPLTVTDPAGGVTTFTYDGDGQLVTAKNPLNNTSTFGYNANGYRTSATDSLGGVTTLTYDAGGRMLSQTDALGHASTYTYDDMERLLTDTDALGHVTTYTYDANGNATSVADALGHVTTYTYDVLDQIETLTDPEGGVVTYGYDAVGNRTSTQDPNLHTTTYAYDALNRRTTTTDALGNTMTVAYDAAGNRTSVMDAKGNTTQYAYDSLDRLVTVTDPVLNTTTYTYDDVGNRLTRTDGNGIMTAYGYDSLNRLMRITYPDSPAVSYTHDALGNRLSMTDLTGTASYAYDALSRLVSVTDPGGAVVSYGYDAAGKRASLTYPDGKSATYAYDGALRLTTVTDWASRVTAYTHDNASRLTGTDLPNGVHAEHSYNDADQLLAIAHSKGGNNLVTVGYTLDPAGNRQARTETVAAGAPLTDNYGYDNLYQLTSVNYSEPAYPDQTYSYDPAGNRTQIVEGLTPTNYAYDAADRLLTAGSTTYAFDNNGNQVLEGSRTFSYDRENRLLQVADWTTSPNGVCADTNWDGTVNSGDLLAVANAFNVHAGSNAYQPVLDTRQDGAVNAGDLLIIASKLAEQCTVAGASAYNGDGLRVYRSESGSTQRYSWDTASSLPVIVQDSASTTYEYGQELILEETAGTPTYYSQDGLGSTVLTTNTAGVSTGTNDYDAFGAPRTPLAAPELGYTGEQRDASGLLYLRARAFDPGSGRFTAVDPILATAQSPRYSYAGNSPTNYVDPLGLYRQRAHRSRPHPPPPKSSGRWICICRTGGSSSIGSGFGLSSAWSSFGSFSSSGGGGSSSGGSSGGSYDPGFGLAQSIYEGGQRAARYAQVFHAYGELVNFAFHAISAVRAWN